MLNATDSIHEQLKAAAEEIRLAHDNLRNTMFAYTESPTDANRRRIESARREYLIAAEDRESLTEWIAELDDWPHFEGYKVRSNWKCHQYYLLIHLHV